MNSVIWQDDNEIKIKCLENLTNSFFVDVVVVVGVFFKYKNEYSLALMIYTSLLRLSCLGNAIDQNTF